MGETTMRRGAPRKPVEIPIARRRTALLQAAGFTQDTLRERIEKMEGVKLARSTVQAVLAGDFRNDLVIKHFCDVTGTKPKDIFPEKEKDAPKDRQADA